VLFAKYNYNEQVKKDETCSTNRRDKCIEVIGGRAKRKDHEEDQDVGI
jgi:hypothetical protein